MGLYITCEYWWLLNCHNLPQTCQNQKQFATNSRSSHIAMVLKPPCAWYLTPNVNAAQGNDAVAGHQVTTEKHIWRSGRETHILPAADYWLRQGVERTIQGLQYSDSSLILPGHWSSRPRISKVASAPAVALSPFVARSISSTSFKCWRSCI